MCYLGYLVLLYDTIDGQRPVPLHDIVVDIELTSASTVLQPDWSPSAVSYGLIDFVDTSFAVHAV